MKSISPSRYLVIFGALSLLLAAGITCLNWAVDPLQFYRKASYPPDFADQARFQNPGLALNYPYDSVVVGTSVSLGFSSTLLRDRLGWDALNLAMSGASAHEQSLITEVALRAGHVRHVMWDVNHEYYRGKPDWVSDFDGAFPAYFYDRNPWNELPNYLLNIDTTKRSIRVLLQRFGLHVYRPRPLHELSRLEVTHPAGTESVMQAFQRGRYSSSVFQEHPSDFSAETLRKSFDENDIQLIQAHPDVTFDLWFPPFSIARHALLHAVAPGVWDEMFRWKQDLLRAVSSLPNVRLHDFQGDPEIVLNLDHYYDTLHFDESVRERIVNAIASRSHVANAGSLVATEALLRKEIERFPASQPISSH